MGAGRPAVDVAHRIKISARLRAADRVRQREESAHCDLRQRWSSLDHGGRSEIRQRYCRQVQAPPEIAVEGKPTLVDSIGADDPRVAEIDVVLAPVEILTRPREVSRAGAHCVRACGEEVITAEPVRGVDLMVNLDQPFIRVVGARHIALPDIAGHVRQRNVVVDDFHGHRIEAIRADDADDAVARKGLAGCGISRQRAGLGEVARPLQRGRHDRGIQEGTGGLPQARVGAEEERLVAP